MSLALFKPISLRPAVPVDKCKIDKVVERRVFIDTPAKGAPETLNPKSKLFTFASCNRPAQPPPVAGPAEPLPLPGVDNGHAKSYPRQNRSGQNDNQWHSGTSTGAVYVGDALFAEGPDGSQDVPWIDLSSSTEFLLFSDPRSKDVARTRYGSGFEVACI